MSKPEGLEPICLILTSCGRHDLLRRTLESFAKFNTYPISKAIIVEDSLTPKPEWLSPDIIWIQNSRPRGQVYSLDRAMAEVDTEYFFGLEDDWDFTRPGFIEKSLEILKQHSNVWTVSLRADDCNGHPLTSAEGLTIQLPGWQGGWGGVNFNPGLRRLSDYRKLGSYGRHCGYSSHGCAAELELSRKQLAEGFRIAALPEKYVEHSGAGRSRAADKKFTPKTPKVLIAIPACHRYTYSNQADGRNHKDNASNERVEAVRRTWQKYLPPFESYVDMKFFYGRGTERLPQSDEVFLDVPDDYLNLPSKVQAIYKYALDNGYDYVFKGDDDTFIYVDRLLASDFQEHDYLGYSTDDPACHYSGRYASGGSGYWLSRKTLEILANFGPPSDWAEDRWVGKVLLSHEIRVQRDARYLPGFWEHFVNVDALPDDHSYITMHACSPSMMDKLFAKTLAPNFKAVKRAFHEPDYEQPAARVNPLQNTSPLAGVRIPKAQLTYGKDTLTHDWWDTHVRPE